MEAKGVEEEETRGGKRRGGRRRGQEWTEEMRGSGGQGRKDKTGQERKGEENVG